MKVKTNVRAGKQNRNRGAGETEVHSSGDVYVPPVSRCVGI